MLLHRTVSLPSEAAGGEDSSELLARLGSGDPGDVAAVRDLGTFRVPPPRSYSALFRAVFTSPSGAHSGALATTSPSPAAADSRVCAPQPHPPVALERQQFVPRHGRLVMTDRALILVVYTGPDTRTALHGGDATRDACDRRPSTPHLAAQSAGWWHVFTTTPLASQPPHASREG